MRYGLCAFVTDALLSPTNPMQPVRSREVGIVSCRDYRAVHLFSFSNGTCAASAGILSQVK